MTIIPVLSNVSPIVYSVLFGACVMETLSSVSPPAETILKITLYHTPESRINTLAFSAPDGLRLAVKVSVPVLFALTRTSQRLYSS